MERGQVGSPVPHITRGAAHWSFSLPEEIDRGGKTSCPMAATARAREPRGNSTRTSAVRGLPERRRRAVGAPPKRGLGTIISSASGTSRSATLKAMLLIWRPHRRPTGRDRITGRERSVKPGGSVTYDPADGPSGARHGCPIGGRSRSSSLLFRPQADHRQVHEPRHVHLVGPTRNGGDRRSRPMTGGPSAPP
jgi:hypothetical protein